MFHGLTHDRHGYKNAADLNAIALAAKLKYSGGPETTPVKKITICNGVDEPTEFLIGEGKYASAVFVHAAATEANFPEEIRITTEMILYLRWFMGSNVIKDAEDPHSDKHLFVSALLGARGGTLIVDLGD